MRFESALLNCVIGRRGQLVCTLPANGRYASPGYRLHAAGACDACRPVSGSDARGRRSSRRCRPSLFDRRFHPLTTGGPQNQWRRVAKAAFGPGIAACRVRARAASAQLFARSMLLFGTVCSFSKFVAHASGKPSASFNTTDQAMASRAAVGRPRLALHRFCANPLNSFGFDAAHPMSSFTSCGAVRVREAGYSPGILHAGCQCDR